MKKNKLKCPIRGELKYSNEEKERIDLIRYLLSKGYEKKRFQFEKVIINPMNNEERILFDLYYEDENIVFTGKIISADEIEKNEIIENNSTLGVKNFLENIDYFIFYDGINNILIKNNIKWPLSSLPKNGMKWGAEKIKFSELEKIINVPSILVEIEQISYSAGLNKEKRYAQIFKIIIAKLYDETVNKDALEFSSKKTNVVKEINALCNNAYRYYSIEGLIKKETVLSIEEKPEVIEISDEALIEIVKLLEGKSLLKSGTDFSQKFFMKFGNELTKNNLGQFYTPLTIVQMICSILEFKPTDKIIDPAGGTADFLIGAKNEIGEGLSMNENWLNYWDTSSEAEELARLNALINGVNRLNTTVMDSIENYEKDNGEYNFVITNPPFGSGVKFFGKDNILNKYEISKEAAKKESKELGILFIERSINLLVENGILIIILPSGYSNNKTKSNLRKFLLKRGEILGLISLPDGAFNGSGTGVKTDIMIFKKTTTPRNDYEIFFANAEKIGFDYKTKNQPEIYKRDEDGSFILNEVNEQVIDNDLLDIANSFKNFAFQNDIDGFKKEDNKLDYFTINLSELKSDDDLILRTQISNPDFIEFTSESERLGYTSLKEQISLGKMVNIGKNTINEKRKKDIIDNSETYKYLPLKEILRGFARPLHLKGWQINLTTRASNVVKENDILMSYLYGSRESFAIFEKPEEDLICSTGFINVNIEDEIIRTSFFDYLLRGGMEIQYLVAATGHIQTNINDEDILNFKFPLLEGEEYKNARKRIESLQEINNWM